MNKSIYLLWYITKPIWWIGFWFAAFPVIAFFLVFSFFANHPTHNSDFFHGFTVMFIASTLYSILGGYIVLKAWPQYLQSRTLGFVQSKMINQIKPDYWTYDVGLKNYLGFDITHRKMVIADALRQQYHVFNFPDIIALETQYWDNSTQANLVIKTTRHDLALINMTVLKRVIPVWDENFININKYM